MFDPEVEAARFELIKVGTGASREELRELRVEIATLKYALRHIYTRVEDARDAFSPEVLDLIGYRKEEE